VSVFTIVENCHEFSSLCTVNANLLEITADDTDACSLLDDAA